MSNYVIIPGGYHGGWWFQPVVEALRARGHGAVAVTLTGVGERRHLVSSTNLETHIEDVLNVLHYEDLDDVVLCAHSYGGMVAAGVADRAPSRIAGLVFLDAQIPRDGESLWELTTESEQQRFVASTRDGVRTEPPRGLDPRATAHPLACFLQPLHLIHGLEPIRRKVFVYMSGWPDSPLARMYDRVRDDPGWHVEVWPNGHDIIGEACQATIELLLREGQGESLTQPPN